MKYNYSTICNSLLQILPQRTRKIIERRFGLGKKNFFSSKYAETLESIGKTYGITRERVRQIEKGGLNKLRKEAEIKAQEIFDQFKERLENWGGLKKEDLLLSELGGNNFRQHVFFLLTLGPQFKRVAETEDLWSFWAIDENSIKRAKRTISSFLNQLKEKQKPLPLGGKNLSYVEISKHIARGPEGLYGLKEWPEINPRRIRDQAYLAFKKKEKPLHFRELAFYIGKKSQSVHNELIKDPRFVLVGRGIYALKEWGYEPGIVKDVIYKILNESNRPMSKEEILKKTMSQRLVKRNTVLLNLQNKKYFVRNSEGKYTIRKA